MFSINKTRRWQDAHNQAERVKALMLRSPFLATRHLTPRHKRFTSTIGNSRSVYLRKIEERTESNDANKILQRLHAAAVKHAELQIDGGTANVHVGKKEWLKEYVRKVVWLLGMMWIVDRGPRNMIFNESDVDVFRKRMNFSFLLSNRSIEGLLFDSLIWQFPAGSKIYIFGLLIKSVED